MSTGKVLLGVVAGLAAGALLGVLFAPDKGSVTRRKIVQKGEDYTSDLKDKFDDFIGTVTDKFNSVKQEGKELVEKGKSKVEDVKRQAGNSVNEKYSTQY